MTDETKPTTRYLVMFRYLSDDEGGAKFPSNDEFFFSCWSSTRDPRALIAEYAYKDVINDLTKGKSREEREAWEKAKSDAARLECDVWTLEEKLDGQGQQTGWEPVDSFVLFAIPVAHGKGGRTTLRWGKTVDGDGNLVKFGQAKPNPYIRNLGPAGKPIPLFIEDEVPGAFYEQPEKAEKIAVHFERSVGWSDRFWSLGALWEHIGAYSHHYGNLVAEMAKRGLAVDTPCCTEIHFSQPDEASNDHGDMKRTIVPAGRKQIWCEYSTGYGWPLSGGFLSVELVYPSGEPQLNESAMCRQFGRACKALKDDERAKSLKSVSYARITQREATSEDEIGAHVFFLPEITEEFAKEWGYPRDEWHKYPCEYIE